MVHTFPACSPALLTRRRLPRVRDILLRARPTPHRAFFFFRKIRNKPSEARDGFPADVTTDQSLDFGPAATLRFKATAGVDPDQQTAKASCKAEIAYIAYVRAPTRRPNHPPSPSCSTRPPGCGVGPNMPAWRGSAPGGCRSTTSTPLDDTDRRSETRIPGLDFTRSRVPSIPVGTGLQPFHQ